MPSQTIQWFPGNMAKTRRMIAENLKHVDITLKLRNARIPLSSENPEIAALTAGKPRITLLNKASLASPEESARWIEACRSTGADAIAIDCVSGEGLARIAPAIRRVLRDKLQKYEDKGMSGRTLKAMIVGIPNVGKSSLVTGSAAQKKRRSKTGLALRSINSGLTTSDGIDLLEYAGVLWRNRDRRVGEIWRSPARSAMRSRYRTLAGILCVRLLASRRSCCAR